MNTLVTIHQKPFTGIPLLAKPMAVGTEKSGHGVKIKLCVCAIVCCHPNKAKLVKVFIATPLVKVWYISLIDLHVGILIL